MFHLNFRKYVITSMLFIVIVFSLLCFEFFGHQTLSPIILTTFFLLLFSLALNIFFKVNYNTNLLSIKEPFIWLIFFVFYLTIHSLILKNFNLFNYLWISLVFACYSILSLEENIKTNIQKSFYNILFFTGLFECLIVFLQYLNFIPTLSPFFNATGTWNNPNVIATYLCFSHLAFLTLNENNLKARKKIIVSFIILITILMLKSRTAILLEIFLLTFFFFFQYYNKKFIAKYAKYFFAFVLIISFLILSLFFKVGSTNGRLLVIENSISLVINRFDFFGKGLGMFEKTYNVFVAENGLPTKGYIITAYNDFIELFIEAGFLGMLCWCLFILLLFIKCKKNRNLIIPTILIVLTQLLNFFFQAIPVFIIGILFITFNSTISYKTNKLILYNKFYNMTIASIITLLIFLYTKIGYSFYAFNRVQTKDLMSLSSLEKLNSNLYFSSLYHKKIAFLYLKNNEPKKAIIHFEHSLQYTADPQVFFLLGKSFEYNKNCESAKVNYTYANKIMPNVKSYYKASLIDCTKYKKLLNEN